MRALAIALALACAPAVVACGGGNKGQGPKVVEKGLPPANPIAGGIL